MFDFRFTEIDLLPDDIGSDGRIISYGECLISGTAEIAFDADGDWWIKSITLATRERPNRFSLWSDGRRAMDRHHPLYGMVKAAIERKCEDEINDAVRERISGRNRWRAA